MQRAIRLAAAFCALAAGVPAAGAADPWLRIKSANFELFTTAGERAGRNLILHFEQVHSFFAQAMGFTSAGARPVRIIAFRSEKEYQPYRPNDFAAAFFEGGFRHDHIVMSSAAADHFPVAIHEYTHLLIRQTNQTIPIWWNEGLADLFSTLQPMAGKIMVGRPIPGRLATLRNEPWIDLHSIVSAAHDSPLYNEKSRAGMFYAESWLLVHMFNLDNSYRTHLKVMLDAMILGASEAAFQKAYGKTIDEIQSDLEQYARSDSVQAVLYKLQLPKSIEAPEIQTNAALPARLALAELLADGPRKRSDAEAAYRQLAVDNPGRWEVEQGLGQFALLQDRDAEAAIHLARAVELASAQAAPPPAELLLEYGRALSATERFPESVIVLRKALRAQPGIPQGHLELGIALVRAGDFEAALEQLKNAKGTPPEQLTRYYYHLGYAYHRLGADAEARAILAKARPLAKTAMESGALDSLQQSLDRAQSVRSPSPTIQGHLLAVECAGKTARLRIAANGRTMLFEVDDARQLQFTCGPQSGQAIIVEYEPSRDPTIIAGKVRALQFP